MKYLTVVRHAKSSWDQPGLPDHDRPLNERGRAAAPALSRFVAKTYLGKNGTAPLLPMPDKLVSSTALRALTTAEIMCDAFGLARSTIMLDSRLYLAEPSRILKIVRDFDEKWNHAAIFGHNPGLHEFADKMLARSAINSMPTCTVVILGLPHEHWGLADWGEAQLIAYITPKALERRFPSEFADICKGGDD